MAAADTQTNERLPTVSVPFAVSRFDFATILGLVFSIGLIIGAIAMGQSDAKFFNLPSVLIVILGTITATCTSYTGGELAQSMGIISKSALRPVRNFPLLARSLMDLATIARKKGLLFLSNYDKEIAKEPFLQHAMNIVIDGYSGNDIRRILQQNIDLEEERQKRAASILRRASEVAPAMGLIGTLVGLVQMLANLENPDTIGPAMAVALLTTFYGAILGSIIMSPLAAKIERNADDEVTAKTIILRTAMSIIKQENPRNLEMLINAQLPPSQRIRYFD
ncbi:MAG: biopolymer transporter ExbB [Zetaproteobacteria bacterium]|nr:MAG: biopolymer transporter ExbB [Zetaproteobacteria bacterium]